MNLLFIPHVTILNLFSESKVLCHCHTLTIVGKELYYVT